MMQPGRHILFGVLLVSLSMLTLETLLPRVFAVYVGPNFVYFSISIALVGLSSGGIIASVWEAKFSARPRRALVTLAVMFSASSFLAIWLTHLAGEVLNGLIDARYAYILAHSADKSISVLSRAIVVPSMAFVLGAGALMAIPFLFAGLCISLAFRFSTSIIGKIYAFDLVGAGLGCVLTVVSLTWLSAANAFVLIGLLSAGAALLFVWPGRSEEKAAFRAACGALAVFAGLLVWGLAVRPPFEFFIHKYAHLRSFYDGPLTEYKYKWTPLGRIALVERQWSPPWNLTPKLRPKHFVAMDLGGHSVLEKFSPENLEVIKHTSIFTDDVMEPFVVPGFYRPALRDYVVLMAGNGQDLMRIYGWYGDRVRLQGVELNPVVYEFGFDEPQVNLRAFFNLPNVKMHIAEGRSFIERSAETFDEIVLSYSGATFATGTGSLASTPQFLFTKEAFEAYLRKLNPRGVLVIAGGAGDEELPDSLRTFVAALETVSPGADAKRHVLCYHRKGPVPAEHYVLYHRNPLTAEEVAKVQEIFASHGLELTYSAFTPASYAPVEKFFLQADPGASDPPLTFHALAGDRIHSDNQPFYYFNLIWGTIGGFLVLGYVGTMASALLVSFVFLFVPLWLARRREGGGPGVSRFYLLAFGLLGAGFILIEVGSIQKFELFLGNPTLTLVVILSVLLIWTGVGSFYSSRLFDAGILSVRKAAFLVVLYGIFVLYFLNSLIYRMMGLSLSVKIPIIALVLLPLGFLLGNLFPQLLRQLGPQQERFVPLAWALNGVFSVAGSNLGAILYLFWGATAVFFLGLVCYAVLGAAATALLLRRAAQSQ